jgi:hypothetical protein
LFPLIFAYSVCTSLKSNRELATRSNEKVRSVSGASIL